MQRFVDIEREFVERLRLGEVAEILEHALDLFELTLDGPLEALAVLDVVEHLDDQLAAVADVLNRMGEVVHQADGDAAEDGLPLFLSHVFL